MQQVHRVLVLTDLVDSTRLVAQVGDERAGELNAAVDRLTRDLLARFGGREIDKTDGFLLLFEQAPEALAFVLELHDALERLAVAEGVPLAMRAGVHAATVGLRENPPEDVARGAKPLEVEGLAKPLAARVMGLAGGRQTLCTETVGREVALASPGIRWVEHGAFRLKGVSEPVRLVEVGREGLAPLRPPPDSEKAWRAASGPLATQREAARRAWAQPAVRAVVLGVVAAAGAGGLYAWDQGRLKRADFAEVVWSPEGLVGVGEPVAHEPRFRVTSRGGRTLEVTEITPGGAPVAVPSIDLSVEMFGVGLLLNPWGSEPNWTMMEGWASGFGKPAAVRSQVRSVEGDLVRLEVRAPAGELTAQATVERTGEGLRLRWQTPYGAPGASPDTWVSVEDLVFDADGRVTGRRFFNVSGLQPMLDGRGAASIVQELDTEGRVVARQWLDMEGEPAEDWDGVASERLVYAPAGRSPIERTVFDGNGAPAQGEDGCHRESWSPDRSSWRCYDTEGAPDVSPIEPVGALDCHGTERSEQAGELVTRCLGVDGALVATQHARFDGHGHLVELRLLDPDGASFAGRERWATARFFPGADGRLLGMPRYTDRNGQPYLRLDSTKGDVLREPLYPLSYGYDEHGSLVSAGFRSEDGDPIEGPYGWSSIQLTRDRAGRPVEARLLDPDGEPTAKRSGVHRLVNTLDGAGRATEVRRFGIDGEPALDEFDAHRDEITWDELGRVSSVAFFGVDGPIERPEIQLRSAGSHKIGIRYDERGRVGRLDYYDTDGRLSTDNGEGVASTVFERDHRGFWTRHYGLDEHGEPVATAWGPHAVERVVGPVIGNREIPLRETYFDVELQPTTLWGCHVVEHDVDARDRKTALRCLDAERRAAPFEGEEVATVRWTYVGADERPATEVLYDVAGERIDGANGVCETRYVFDATSRVVSREFRNAAGELVAVGEREAAITELDWDDEGRLAGMTFRGVDGEVVPGGLIGLTVDEVGLPLQWRTYEPGGGLSLVVEIARQQDGLAEEVRLVDADGSPVDHEVGWARVSFEHVADEDSTVARTVTATYVDLDGAPAPLWGRCRQVGASAFGDAYLELRPEPEDLSELQGFGRFDPGTARAGEGPAWSGWVVRMDALAREVRRTYLDAEGEPIVPLDPGYATVETAYAGGEVAERRFLDAVGAPLEVCGIARTELGDEGWIGIAADGSERALPEACADDDGFVRQRG